MTTFHPEYRKQATQETDEETTNHDTTSLNGLNNVASTAPYDKYGRRQSQTTPSVLTLVLSLIYPNTVTTLGGTRRRSWFRHSATSLRVAGSIADGIIGIFHRHNASDYTMTLGLTQPLTVASIRNTSWGG